MPSKLFACFTCSSTKADVDEYTVLDFRHACLTDVPPDVFLSERTLEELYLDANQLCDLPRQLFLCHGLRTLGLSDNDLQSVPVAVSALTSLSTLDLSKNSISSIPDAIKCCKQLSIVNASINPLCHLPEGFTQLLSLRELYLNDTFLEYLPANFGRLAGLQVLELRENQLNTLPKSLARLTQLYHLDIGLNDFSELPEVIGSLGALTELWFDSNRVKSVPPAIGKLESLKYCDASKNKIDTVSDEIGQCLNLTDLYLSCNDLKDLPDGICKCRNLQLLHLDDNVLECLPADFGQLNSLGELVASQNRLEYLPSSIGLLRSLHTLHLDSNMLLELPSEIGSCTALRVLTVASNRLSEFPPELGHLTGLVVLNVCDNQLLSLPVSFTKLKLKALWLADNQTKPTVQLRSETCQKTGKKILSCYLLPQMPRRDESQFYDHGVDTLPSNWEEKRRTTSSIKFSFEDEGERPSSLTRAPTPYPKELKALAKHARNLQAIHKENREAGNRKENLVVRAQSGSISSPAPKVSSNDEMDGAVESRGSLAKVGQAPSSHEKPMEKCVSDNVASHDSAESSLSVESKENVSSAEPQKLMEPHLVEKPVPREAHTVRSIDSLPPDDSASPTYTIGDRKVIGHAEVVATSAAHAEPGSSCKSDTALSVEAQKEKKILSSAASPVTQGVQEECISSSSSSADSGYSNGQQYSVQEDKNESRAHVEAATHFPSQSATGASLAAADAHLNQDVSKLRPNSLALNEGSPSGYLLQTPLSNQYGRPGSLAAPINTLGIPPAPARAVSYMGISSNVSLNNSSFGSDFKSKQQKKDKMDLVSTSCGLSDDVSLSKSAFSKDADNTLERIKLEDLPKDPSSNLNTTYIINGHLDDAGSLIESSEHLFFQKAVEEGSLTVQNAIKMEEQKMFGDANSRQSFIPVASQPARTSSSCLKPKLSVQDNYQSSTKVASLSPASSNSKEASLSSSRIPTLASLGRTSSNMSKESCDDKTPPSPIPSVSPTSSYVNQMKSDKTLPSSAAPLSPHAHASVSEAPHPLSNGPSHNQSHLPVAVGKNITALQNVSVRKESQIPHLNYGRKASKTTPDTNVASQSHGTASTKSNIPSRISGSQLPVASASQLPMASASQLPMASASQLPMASVSQLPVASASQLPMASASQLPMASASQLPMPPTKSVKGQQGAVKALNQSLENGAQSSRIPPSAFSNSSRIATCSTPPVQQAINTSGVPPLPSGKFGLHGRTFGPSSISDSRIPTAASTGSQLSYSGYNGMSRLPMPGSIAGHHKVSAGEIGSSGGQPAWMCGQHKTANVFPVVIEKNPGLGFTFASTMDGNRWFICVTSVLRGGPASSALKVGDRILQVDEVDLEGVDAATAHSIFNSTSSTLSLMVSRAH